MLDIRKLVMLRAVAAEGSIAAAARSLRYTRSAVSQQLSLLESETGTALVDRVGNRITLTPAGRALVEHTERILVELRSAEAMLSSGKLDVSGLLRVGVPFREGPQIMSRALSDVRRRYPHMEIRLVATTNDLAAELVLRDQLDLVIVSRFGVAHPPALPGLREWVLGHDPLRLCVPAEHRLAAAAACSVADLRDEAWVVCPTTALGRMTVNLCVAAGYEPVVAASVDDIGTALGLVGIGWGITIAPELTPVAADLGIVRMPITGLSTDRYSVLVVRDGEHTSPRIAAAITAVRAIGDHATGWEPRPAQSPSA